MCWSCEEWELQDPGQRWERWLWEGAGIPFLQKPEGSKCEWAKVNVKRTEGPWPQISWPFARRMGGSGVSEDKEKKVMGCRRKFSKNR